MRKPITEPYQVKIRLLAPGSRTIERVVWSDNLAFHLEDYYQIFWRLVSITRVE